MQEINITRALPENAREILEVLHKTWLATYPNAEHGITVEDIEESYKDSYTEESLERQADKIATPENELRLVAKVGGRVVGLATMIRNEGTNQLRTLYVLPEYQGKGIGKMLWNEARKFCDPAKDIIVEVVTYNQKAIEFYKRQGFVDTGKRLNFNIGRMARMGTSLPEMEMIIKAQ